MIPCLPFVAPPGKVFEYCSLGIDLAGYVAEVVGGMYFPDLVHELLLRPLGMTRTTYDRTVAMTYPIALPHKIVADGTMSVQHRMFDYAAANPVAQAMTSTCDLARFVAILLNSCVHYSRWPRENGSSHCRINSRLLALFRTHPSIPWLCTRVK